MKKLALSLVALGIALVSLSTTSPANAEDEGIELACKPRGSACHNSNECCSQNCQSVNGKETCH